MAKVSAVIPSRNEPYLEHTINDLFAKATGEIEVIVTLDGYWPTPMPMERPGLTFIHRGQAQGMRAAINGGVSIAKGEYILKTDAHCMFAEGWDEALKHDCERDWVVVPRRHRLDVEKWRIREDKPEPIDYHYLSYPYNDKNPGLHGTPWPQRAKERAAVLIDDEMSSQGSCYFMSREHFTERLYGLDDKAYGTFIQEFQEIGMKTWLGGGRVVVNKNTWYAHWHKTEGRGYSLNKAEGVKGTEYCTDYWMNNRWSARKYNISWLIGKFWPVPTWPEDWMARW